MLRFIVYLFLCSAFCISLGELTARFFFDPSDILQVTYEDDPILGHKIGSLQSGHDEWGFRNKAVPQNADILILGDSFAYGTNATANNSWPAQLENKTGQTVYNTGISGYGPLHYLHILKDRAPHLTPQHAIFSIYLGDDFGDAYDLAYAHSEWASYRNSPTKSPITASAYAPPMEGSIILDELSLWLGKRSVLYGLIAANSGVQLIKNQPNYSNVPTIAATNKSYNSLLATSENTNPRPLTDQRQIEGFSITARAIKKAHDYCQENDIKFHVVLVPAKEHVIAHSSAKPLKKPTALVNKINILEYQHAQILDFLKNENISYVDLHSAFIKAIGHADIYPETGMHTTSLGYEVSALAVSNTFQLHKTE
ncbi:MAG: hypothetical protein ACPGVT_05880 [Maricaulaceae bacterium]